MLGLCSRLCGTRQEYRLAVFGPLHRALRAERETVSSGGGREPDVCRAARSPGRRTQSTCVRGFAVQRRRAGGRSRHGHVCAMLIWPRSAGRQGVGGGSVYQEVKRARVWRQPARTLSLAVRCVRRSDQVNFRQFAKVLSIFRPSGGACSDRSGDDGTLNSRENKLRCT